MVLDTRSVRSFSTATERKINRPWGKVRAALLFQPDLTILPEIRLEENPLCFQLELICASLCPL